MSIPAQSPTLSFTAFQESVALYFPGHDTDSGEKAMVGMGIIGGDLSNLKLLAADRALGGHPPLYVATIDHVYVPEPFALQAAC